MKEVCPTFVESLIFGQSLPFLIKQMTVNLTGGKLHVEQMKSCYSKPQAVNPDTATERPGGRGGGCCLDSEIKMAIK